MYGVRKGPISFFCIVFSQTVYLRGTPFSIVYSPHSSQVLVNHTRVGLFWGSILFFWFVCLFLGQCKKAMAPHSSTLAWKIPWTEEPGRLQSMGSRRVRHEMSGFPFTFHFHALEKEMATHSSVLAWRIPGTGEPGGLLSMGSHRVRHD